MSYLERDWSGPDRYMWSFLEKGAHPSEIIVECAERELIQDIHNVPSSRPIMFVQMCAMHDISSDIARAMAPLERGIYHLFQRAAFDALNIVEDILNKDDESVYYENFQDLCKKAMENAPPIYRNQAIELFERKIPFSINNRNHLHDMAQIIENMDYNKIQKLPAFRKHKSAL